MAKSPSPGFASAQPELGEHHSPYKANIRSSTYKLGVATCTVKATLITSVICLHWLAGLTAIAEDSQLYFDKLTKDKYILVVLGENGKAEFLLRETQPDGTILLLHDRDATWGYFSNQPKNARPNIRVSAKHFRFDYFLEEKRLTEIDKMGVQNILTKRKMTK